MWKKQLPPLVDTRRGLKPYHSEAFSLVEIGVVISIIVILAVLLFPAMQGAYSKGMQITCMGNLRSYGNAFFTYVADNNGLPRYRYDRDSNGNITNTNSPDFGKIASTFFKTPLRCPLRGNETKGFYYAINGNLSAYYPTLANIPVPISRVVFAAENNGTTAITSFGHLNRTIWANNNGSAGSEGTADTNLTTTKPQYHGNPSKRGLNLMFVDGHQQLVFPIDNDWSKPPVYGPQTTAEAQTNKGFFYSTGQFGKMITSPPALHDP